MIKIIFNDEDITALRYGRFQPPDSRVQVRREALYWRSQGVANADILRLYGIAKARFPRDLKAYVGGGVAQLKRIEPYRPHRELTHHRPTLEAYLQQHPPATVAAAVAKIAELTGMVRPPPQVRPDLRALGMQPLHVGRLPAKADVAAQAAFQKTPGAQVRGGWGGPARRLVH